jgi:AraC-like DNA-binding protein
MQRFIAILGWIYDDGLDETLGEAGSDPYRDQVAAACRRLDCHLDEPIDLRALAEELGLGYETFRKVFRDRMRVAPGAYRVQKRIDRGCAMLVHASLSVGEVAQQLGYSDSFAFSAQFKRLVGESPSAYRLSHRQELVEV